MHCIKEVFPKFRNEVCNLKIMCIHISFLCSFTDQNIILLVYPIMTEIFPVAHKIGS